MERNNNIDKKKFVELIVFVVVVSTLIQFLILWQLSRFKLDNMIQDAYIQGQNITSTIQLTLDNATEATKALKYFYLDTKNPSEESFDKTAEVIVEDHNSIESVYIAPDGVIKYAYPESVKESTIGFEMLKDPAQGPRAQFAIDTGKITAAGPHNLVEGGQGLILRNPVFENGEFKAFTILVLDWEECVEEILNNLGTSMQSYNFAVWKEDADETAVVDEDGFIFRSSSDPISKEIDIEFEVPNDTWHLTVEPIGGFKVVSNMTVDIVVSVVIALTIDIIIVLMWLTNERKKQLQIQQTENNTKSLYLKQLSTALEKAEKADVAKTSFLSKMSHDIRTPLNGIIGLIQIEEKHPNDLELINKNRSKIKVSANHLLELINDILEIAKLDDDNVHLVNEPIDLLKLAKDTSVIIGNRAIEEGIEIIRNNYSEALEYPYVYASPLHLRQIFINLYSNAIKYNKKNGKIYSNIYKVFEDEKNVTYQVTVEDTGIGMSEEFLKHLFEPFSQEHNDEKSFSQGTGLGMSIVKSLVEKMNGTILVESKLNVGTKFTVTVPFTKAKKEEIIDKSEQPLKDISGMKILLVEDNELNTEIAETILLDAGASIVKAKDGQEALEIYANSDKGSFDVILTDVMMPKMTGYELSRAIREFDKDIPIIAMTANAFEEDRQNALASGMNSHVAKPIDVATLMKVLAENVNNK